MALPLRPAALYWVYWFPVYRLRDIPTAYNIITLFHAPGQGGGSTGAVNLIKPSGAPGTNLNADIVTCRARGQRILVSAGGAGGQAFLNSQARADAFVESIKVINLGLGAGTGTTKNFDGVDFNNFEGGGSTGEWMTYAALKLKAYYGADFLCTSPPAAFEFFAGGQAASDRLVLATMHRGGTVSGYSGTGLDWMCPQYYDPSNLNTLSNVRTGSDWYHGTVTVPASATLGTASASVAIPRDKIGIGFALKTGSSDSQRWGATQAVTAYTTMQNEGKTPRGAFNWTEDASDGYTQTIDLFATNVAPTINPDLGGDTTAPVPGASGVLNFTSITDTSIRVNWSRGTDDSTAQASLQYEVRRSLTNNIATVANAEANGTIVTAYSSDIITSNSTGLTPNTTYYFNVIIKDLTGNKAAYTMNNQITTAPTGGTRNTTGVGSMTGVGSITL